MPTSESEKVRQPQASSRQTHATRIFVELRRDILAGHLKPGSRIKTVTMSDRFGVGLSPLREALNRLASEGLIIQTDRRGFSVSPVSEEELVDITNSRIWAHSAALRASIENGDHAWEERVILAFHRLLRTPRTAAESIIDSEEWIEQHRAFHMSLLSSCGSLWMLKISAQVFEAGERYRHLGSLVSDARRHAAEEHEGIMQAAVNRRSDEAVELLSSHYRKTQIHLREVLGSLAAYG